MVDRMYVTVYDRSHVLGIAGGASPLFLLPNLAPDVTISSHYPVSWSQVTGDRARVIVRARLRMFILEFALSIVRSEDLRLNADRPASESANHRP